MVHLLPEGSRSRPSESCTLGQLQDEAATRSNDDQALGDRIDTNADNITSVEGISNANRQALAGLAAIPTQTSADEQGLKGRAGTLYWEEINEVPDTPGTTSGIGHVLTVNGENDRDYHWGSLDDIAVFSELETEVNSAVRSLADIDTRLNNLGDLQSVTVATDTSYQGTLNSQLGSAKPLILVISADIRGTRGGAAYTWPSGQVLYFGPTSDSAEALFIIGQGGGTTDLSAYRTASAQDTVTGNQITTALEPYRTRDNQDLVIVAQVAEQYSNLTPRYLDVEPGVYQRQAVAAQQFHVTIHGYPTDALPDVNNIRVLISGQVVHTEQWTARAHSRVIDFEVSTTESQNVLRNLRTATTVNVQVQFQQGGTLVENSPIRQIPVATGGLDLPAVILQAATNGCDTCGVTTVRLPLSYTTYNNSYLAVWDINNDVILEFEIHTSVLAAQTAEKSLVFGTWNPTTRIITASAGYRIIFADLE